MGIYIKGMDMPKDNCEAIQQITITNNWIDGEIKILAYDSITNEFIGEVVEVPEPHGRLIDIGKFSKWFEQEIKTADKNKANEFLDRMHNAMENAVVIEAEGE